MKLSKFEGAALTVLAWHPHGLYGNEFVLKMPKFWFVRSRIYTALARLIDAGLVREEHDPPLFPASHLHRVRHFLTPAGFARLTAR